MRSIPIGRPKGTTIFKEIEDQATKYYETTYLDGYSDFAMSNDDSNPDEVVKEGAQPFGELEILWMVENYHSLPYAGGLFDQPNLLMTSLNICRNVRDRTLEIRRRLQKFQDETRKNRK